MPLSPEVAVKFDLYTLACRELLTRYGDLERATRSSPHWPHTKCLEFFDNRLYDFFRMDIADKKAGSAQRLGESLQNLANSFRGHVRKAGELFDQIAAALPGKADAWDHLDHLIDLKGQGRDLARRFYGTPPPEAIRQRLEMDCSLEVKYDSTGKLAPACYLERDQTIRLHFNFEPKVFHRFKDYLAYPFYIIHEFTGHIFALDNGNNDVFHDGWMICAAEKFLWEEWIRTRKEGNVFELIPEQMKVPDGLTRGPQRDHTPDPGLERDCQKHYFHNSGYNLALEFHTAFNKQLMPMTRQLAAFEPRAGEQPYWVTGFLNSLKADLDRNQAVLYGKLRKIRDVRKLRGILTSV